MRGAERLSFVFAFFIFLLPTAVGQEVVHIGDLVAGAKDADGKLVSIQGEAIGDLMGRGDHVWLNVLEEGTAVGVWLTRDQARLVHNLGRYGREGDRVLVVGNFHRACGEHGGDLDIHAVSLRILRQGVPVEHAADGTRLWVGLALCLSGGLLLYLWWHRRRRSSLGRQGGETLGKK